MLLLLLILLQFVSTEPLRSSRYSSRYSSYRSSRIGSYRSFRYSSKGSSTSNSESDVIVGSVIGGFFGLFLLIGWCIVCYDKCCKKTLMSDSAQRDKTAIDAKSPTEEKHVPFDTPLPPSYDEASTYPMTEISASVDTKSELNLVDNEVLQENSSNGMKTHL